MTRHITDHPKPEIERSRAGDFMRLRRKRGTAFGKVKLIDHPRPAGHGRLNQFLLIARGRRI